MERIGGEPGVEQEVAAGIKYFSFVLRIKTGVVPEMDISKDSMKIDISKRHFCILAKPREHKVSFQQ